MTNGARTLVRFIIDTGTDFEISRNTLTRELKRAEARAPRQREDPNRCRHSQVRLFSSFVIQISSFQFHRLRHDTENHKTAPADEVQTFPSRVTLERPEEGTDDR